MTKININLLRASNNLDELAYETDKLYHKALSMGFVEYAGMLKRVADKMSAESRYVFDTAKDGYKNPYGEANERAI